MSGEPEIIFVRTRYDYKSYIDFWRLVELAGFSTIYVSEVELSHNAVYITPALNDEWAAQVEPQVGRLRLAHAILWDFERPVPRGGLGQYSRNAWELISRRLFDEIWVSDRQLAKETGLRYVILGSDFRLGYPGKNKRYDFIHLSYVNERRRKALEIFDCVLAPNCWPPERDAVLRQSRFGLNIHQDQQPFLEPLRLALFAAYGLPTLTEAVADPHPWNDLLVQAPYSELASTARRLLEEPYGKWERRGRQMREVLAWLNFGQAVEEAVDESVGVRLFGLGTRAKVPVWTRVWRWLRKLFCY